MAGQQLIYYVEDDAHIRDLTRYALEKAGFEARCFPDADGFFAALADRVPALILLDIMLPGIDGLEILRRLRDDATTEGIPVMMLTAKGTEYDTVVGLDAGADDYLAKPFGMMELVSRVNALLRRAEREAAAPAAPAAEGPIALNAEAHMVTAGGVPVSLTLKEFELLRVLMANEGRVLTRDQLLDQVWDMAFAGGTRTVDAHVTTLRQKLAAACPGAEALVVTVRGVGYGYRRGDDGR